MEEWGEIKLTKIDIDDFWHLYDELQNDESGFLNNRSTILEAQQNGNLYGLRINETDEMYERGSRGDETDEMFETGSRGDETDEMYERGSRGDEIFCKNSMYLLPCFCVEENNNAIIIWTHTRARKKGFAKKLVNLLNIKYADTPLPDSIDFWKKCNIELKYYKNQFPFK
jgi:hypothetical protein